MIPKLEASFTHVRTKTSEKLTFLEISWIFLAACCFNDLNNTSLLTLVVQIFTWGREDCDQINLVQSLLVALFCLGSLLVYVQLGWQQSVILIGADISCPDESLVYSYKISWKQDYEEALIKSRDNVDLKYTRNKSIKPNSSSLNVIWFNPSFCKSVSLNIANVLFRCKKGYSYKTTLLSCFWHLKETLN